MIKKKRGNHKSLSRFKANASKEKLAQTQVRKQIRFCFVSVYIQAAAS